jgi:hypothetical protein
LNKICSIHQPNFTPWLGYFSKIAQSDVFIILDNVEYQVGNANSITNRVKIKTQNGELFFTIPIRKSELKNINQQMIDWQQPWLKKQLKTLEMNYAKAPFKKEAFDFFHPLLNQSFDNLAAYNSNIIQSICNELKIETQIKMASTIENISDDKNQRLIDLCKRFDCNIYLSGNGAKKYNDENLYNKQGVEIIYTSFTHPVYPQLHGEFNAGLSIIDAWMNCGKNYLIELFAKS